MEINEISAQIIDASIKIHIALGPGLLEAVYEEVLTYELSQRGLLAERQIAIPIIYEGTKMKIGFRADVLVEKKIIVEIKSCESIAPIHKKKVNGYYDFQV
jgi:GxxExxY protein